MAARWAQESVQRLLDDLIAAGEERGLQVTAYHRGELVVDAWAGTTGASDAPRVDGATLFPVYSTSKGVAATVIHALVQRGILEYDEPLATRWPEFAAQGKTGITLRHALAHLAGVPHMPDATIALLGNWPEMCARIADLSPLWPPGERTYYHAITYSWLIGEIACRATGLGFRELVEQEVCRPLGLDSLFIGITESRYAQVARRIARLEPEPARAPLIPDANADPLIERSIPPWVHPLEEWMNRPDAHRSCVPSSSGVMTARAIAAHYAALIGDGVDGVRLLDERSVREATRRHRPRESADPNQGFGLGYALMGPPEDPGSVFGHGGYGGSLGFADTRHQLAVGFAKNRMTGGGPQGSAADRIVAAIRGALGAT
jgi:CubicO group peptidase (beta-lactamase class C family)